MHLATNTRKALRDLAVLIVPTALLYIAEHLADFGVPEEAMPVAGAVALMVYRLVRDLLGKGPDTTTP